MLFYLSLFLGAGLAREAGELFRLAEEANNRSVLAENKIISAEEALEGVADDIIQTRSNVQEAADALNAAENKCKEVMSHLSSFNVHCEFFSFFLPLFSQLKILPCF